MTSIYRKLCIPYELSRILSVKHVVSDGIEYFEHKLMLQPNNATFKGNLVLREKVFVVYGDVKRLSLYKRESSCMSDYRLHGFCYCENKQVKIT